MRRRLVAPLVGALCLSIVPLAGAAPAARAEGRWSKPAASSQLEQLPCAELLFVGARGSGEPAPFGHTITGVASQLAAVVPRRTQVVYLDYPAVSPHSLEQSDLQALVLDQQQPATDYFESVRKGREAVVALLDSSRRRCPDQRVLLVGFSQGAQVLTEALSSGVDRRQVAATILLGNPAHFPGQNARELDAQIDSPSIGLVSTLSYLRRRALETATTDHRTAVHNLISEVFRLYEGKVTSAQLAGTLTETGNVLPASGYPSTFSVCQVDDMVCDAAPALSRVLASSSEMPDEYARARPVHNGYTPQVMQRTLTEVARIVNGEPEPTSGQAPRPDAPASVPVWVWVLGIGQLALFALMGWLVWSLRGQRR